MGAGVFINDESLSLSDIGTVKNLIVLSSRPRPYRLIVNTFCTDVRTDVHTDVRKDVLIVLSCDKMAGLDLIVIGYHKVLINTPG